MKSRYINNGLSLLMAVLLLLSVFPAAAGGASLISGKNIPDQFLSVNFDTYAVADLTEVFSGTASMTFSASGNNANVTAQIMGSVLFLKPVFNAAGLTTVTVTASDGTSATDTFDVNIYAKVLEPGGAAYNLFGNAVAISGTYAIAGAPNSSGKGAAYIYTYSAANGWAFSQKLTASDGAAGDYFGYAVAISGDYAIVGAYRNSQKGAAYIFKKGASSWSQVKKLTASDGASNDYFGYSVSIIGVGTDYYAAVGAPYDDDKGDDSGSVYVFKGKDASWTQMGLPLPTPQVPKLIASDGLIGDNFGGAVAISKDTSNYVYVLAGATSDDIGTISNAGSAYIFKYNFVSWAQKSKLTADSAVANDGFGAAVAMYGGDTAVVGPKKVSGSGSKVFVYPRTAAEWPTTMTSSATGVAALTASDGTATDQFGTAVAIDQNYILVGAYNNAGIGAAYLYKKATAWPATETKKLIAGDGISGDNYGSAVGIYFNGTNYFAVVGAPGDNVNGSNAGAVYFNAEVSPTSAGATTISDIASQIINMNTAASPTSYTAAFTVCDSNSTANLTISASVTSANPSLIPSGSIKINGNAVPYNYPLSGSFCDNLSITVTPALNQVGTANITVTVTGSTGTPATDTFTLTVTGSPIISDIPAVTKRIGSGAATVGFTVSDPDTPIANVTVSAASGNTALVPSSGLTLSGTGNMILTITPAAGASGQSTITVSASDGASPTVYKSFVFTVTAKPVISNVTDPLTTNEDTSVTAYFKVTDPDTLAANLTVSASSSDQLLLPNANIVLTRLSTPDANGNNFQIVLTPAKDQAGTATVTLSAKDEYSDAQGDTTTASFTFSVTMLDDDPPVIERVMPVRQEVTADSAQTLTSAGGTITGMDGEGNAVSVAIAPSDTISVNMGTLTKVMNISGTMPISTNDVVTVYIGSVAKISSTVIPEDTVSENIQVLVDDPDGDFLTVSVTSQNTTLLPSAYPNIKVNGFPFPYMVDTADGKIPMMLSLTPVEDLWGTTLISVTVTDDNGNSTTHSFLLTVSQVNDKPTISVNETMLIPIPDQTITAEESFKEITFYVNDLDGDTLTLEATATSANALLLPNDADHISINGSGTTATVTTSPGVNKTCKLKLTPTDGEWGAVDMVLKVTDGKGGVVENKFVLRVNYVDKKLTISNIEDQTTRENTPISFGFIVGGLEAPSDQLQVDITSSNPMLVPDTQNIAYNDMGDGFYTVQLTPLPNEIGTTTLYVILTDPVNGNKAMDDFVLTVTSTNNPPAIEIIGLTNLSTSKSNPIEVRFDVFDKETPAESLIVSFEYTYKGIVYQYPNNSPVSDDPISQILVVGFENKIQVSNGLIIPGGQTTTLPNGYYADLVVKVVPRRVGDVMITVTVKDERNISSNDYFNLLIYDPNLVPKIEKVFWIENGTEVSIAKEVLTIVQDTQSPEILVKLSDGDDNPLKVSVTSNNPTLVPVTSANINFNGVGPNTTVSSTDYKAGPLSLYITPAAGQTGEATITITVEDANGGTATEVFYLNVLPLGGVNIMPKIDSIIWNDPNADPPFVEVVNIEQNTNTGNIEIRVSDTNSDTLTVSVSSGNEDLVPNESANINIDGVGTQRSVPSSVYTTTPLILIVTPAQNTTGEAIITVTVNDNRGGTASKNFRVNVRGNAAPEIFSMTLMSSPTQDLLFNNTITIQENQQPANIQIKVKDMDSNSLTVSVKTKENEDLVPNSTQNYKIDGIGALSKIITVDSTSREGTFNLSVIPLVNKSGSAVITVSVTDGTNDPVTKEFILNVTAILPTIQDIAHVTIMQNTQTSAIPIIVNDGDKDALTITVTSDKPALVPVSSILINGSASNNPITISAVSGTYPQPSLVIKPALNTSGTAWITVSVTDGGTPVETKFLLTVTPNLPPIIESMTLSSGQNLLTNKDIALDENQQPGTIAVRIKDSDSTSLTFSVSSDNTALVPNNTQGFKIDGTGALSKILTVASAPLDKTVDLSVIPLANQSGKANITVTVTDGVNPAVTATFAINVTAILPTIDPISNVTIMQNTQTSAIPIVVNDGDKDSLTITVTSDKPALVPVSSILINGSASNNPISISAASGSYPQPSLVIKPATNQTGTCWITVSVTDGGTPAETKFLLTVTPNMPPIIESMTLSSGQNLLTNKDIALDENQQPGTIAIRIKDSDSTSLTFSVSSDNTALVPNNTQGFKIDGTGAVSKILTVAAAPLDKTVDLSVILLANQSGKANITVTVTDGVNPAVTATFAINVTAILPTIQAMSNVTIMENTQTAAIPIVVNDGDKDPLTITVTSDKDTLVPADSILINGAASNNPLVISAVSGSYPQPSLVIKPAAKQTGTCWITVSVTDGGTPAETKFLLTVTPNMPPLIQPMLYIYPDPKNLGQFLSQDLLSNNTITINENQQIDKVKDDPNQDRLIRITVKDDDDTSVILSVKSENTALVPENSQGFKIDGIGAVKKTLTAAAAPLDQTVELSIIPVKNKSGTAKITVFVDDGDNSIVTAEIVLNVTPLTAVIESIRLVKDQITALQDSTLADGSTIAGTQGEMLAITAQDFVRINDEPPFTVGATSTPVSEGDVVTVYNSDATFVSEVRIMENGKTGLIEIEISDADSDTLVVSAGSSNTTLVPLSAMDIDGYGYIRTASSTVYAVPLNLVITPAAGKNGSSTITVSVDENQGEAPVTASFLLTVTPYINYSPQINSILLVNGQITGETGTITKTGGTIGSTVIKSTDTVKINDGKPFLVSTLATGLTITVEATDTVTLYQAVYQNGATVSDIVIDQNTQTGKIEVWIDDLNGEQLTVSASAVNTTLVPTNPSNINFDGLGTSRAVSATTYKTNPVNLWLTPASNQSGTTNITVSVTDNVAAAVSKSFMLVVNPTGGVNFVPKIDKLRYVRIPYTVKAGETFTIAPNQTVTWSADESMTIKAGDAVRIGTGNLEEITSGYSKTVTGETTFVLHQSIAQGVITVNENTPVEVRIYVSDANLDPLTVSAKSGNPTLIPQTGNNLNIDGAGMERTVAYADYASPKNLKLVVTPAVDKTGTDVVEVTVKDDKGFLATSSFYLTVKQATGPRIIFDPNTMTGTDMDEDTTYDFPFWVSSAEGGIMEVSVSSTSPLLSPRLLTPSALQVVDAAAPVNQINEYGGTIRHTTGTFTVKPGQTLLIYSVNPVETVTIGPGILPFTLTAGQTVEVYENYNHVFMTLSGNGLDSNNRITTVPTIQHPLYLTLDPADNANSDIFGKADIFLTLTEVEGQKRTVTRKLILTVKPVNDAPLVTFLTAEITPEGSASTTYNFDEAPRDEYGNLEIPENAKLVVTVQVENADKDQAGNTVSVNVGSLNKSLVPQDVDHIRIGNEYFPYTMSLLSNYTGTFRLTVIPAQDANSDLYNFGRMTVTVTGKSGVSPTAEEFILNVVGEKDMPSINQGLGIADQTINEDNTPVTTNNPLAFTVEDKDWENLVVKIWSDNNALIPSANIGLTGTGLTSTLVTEDLDGDGTPETSLQRLTVPTNPNGKYDLKLAFSPLPNTNSTNNGTAIITVLVEKADNATLFSKDTFVLTVTPRPDMPVLAGIPLNLSLTVNESSDTTVWPALKFSTYQPQPPGPITITVTDPDWGLLTVKAYGVSAADKVLIPDANIRLYKLGEAPGLTPGSYQLSIADNTPVPIDLELTPAPYKTGIATIRVELTDGTNSVTRDFYVEVKNINTPPAIASITLPTAPVNEESVTSIPFTLHEWDLDTVTMTASVISTVPAGLDIFSTEITGTGVSIITNPDSTKSYVVQTQPDTTKSLTLKLTGKKDQFGTANVKLLVTDAGGLFDKREFEIVVANVNDPPTITATYTPPLSTDEEKTFETPVSFTVDDVDKENLTISVTSSRPEIVPVNSIFIGGLFTDPNAPPVAGGDLSVHLIDTSAGAKTLTIAKFIPAANQSGLGNIIVNISDSSATKSFIFIYEVKPLPDPPSLKFEPVQGTTPQNTPFEFNILAGDVDGDTVTVTANVTQGADIVPNANVDINGTGTTATAVTLVGKEYSATLPATLTPLPNKVGTVKIAVTVTDNIHTPLTKEFVLTVTPVYATPTITAASPQSIEGEKDAYITFMVTDKDTPYTSLAFTVTSQRTAMIPQSNITLPPQLIPEQSNLDEGYYWFRLGLRSAPNVYSTSAADTAGIKIDVNDGTSLQVTATVAVYVGKPGTAPSIINFPNSITINEDEQGVVSFSVRDENTNNTGFTIKIYSDHPDLVPNVNIGNPAYLGTGGTNTYNYQFSFMPAANAFSVNSSDLAVIHIEVSDDRFTDSQTFTVRILEQNDKPEMVITSVLPLSGKENESKTVSLYVYDWDGGILNLSAMSQDNLLVQSQKLKFTLPGSTAKLTQITVDPGVPFFLEFHITPEINKFGTVDIKATVADTSGALPEFSQDTETITYNIGEVKPGDLNIDGLVDLRDAILALQIAAGIQVTGVNRGADVNNDTRLSHVEAIFVLQEVAGLR